MDDFIAVYPQALSIEKCREIIARFESSSEVGPGQIVGGVHPDLKDSFDLTISNKAAWRDITTTLHRIVFEALLDYIRRYPFLMIGPLALRMQNPTTGEVFLVNEATFPQLTPDQLRQLALIAFRSGTVNIQKYLADRGGYPHWHSELCPGDASCETLHRVLLYSFYLNDVPEEGETEFYYQKRKIRPEAGTLLIAPAFFTHTHRGNRPKGGDKYIATSWILFSRAERLHGRHNPH